MKKLLSIWLFPLLMLLSPLLPLSTHAAYYMGEITIQKGTSQRVELGEIGYDLMKRYGYDKQWNSINTSTISIISKYKTYCTIRANNVGTTKLNYTGYYRNGIVSEYECYWDVVVISGGGGEGDAPHDDSDNVGHDDDWSSPGNYSYAWFNNSTQVFTITTEKELAGLAYLVNNGYSDFQGKTIQLGADINLNGKNWTSIGLSSSNTFKGTFDGQGHTIDGLFIGRQNKSQKNIGFFGYIDNATIRKLHLKGEVNVHNPGTGCQNVGGLAGYAYSGLIEHCSCEMPVTFSNDISSAGTSGSFGDIAVGGLIGQAGSNIIRYCVHKGNITCKQTPNNAGYNGMQSPIVGGLIGSSTAEVSYCEHISSEIKISQPYQSYSSWNIYAGGLIGQAYKTVLSSRSITSFDIEDNGFPYAASIKCSVGGISGTTTFVNTNSYSCISSVKLNSACINQFVYCGVGGNEEKCKATYSNSDVIISANRNMTIGYNGSTSFTASQMKTDAFIEEMNTYTIINNGKRIWTADEDGYPCIAENGTQAKEQLTLSATPASGEVEKGTLITLKASNPEATIYYTLDGTSPTTNSTRYDAPILVDRELTLKAFAVLNGYYDSDELTLWYSFPAMIPVSDITLNRTTATMQIGQQIQLLPTIAPCNATDNSVIWTSNDNNVASVDKKGLVTAIGVGSTVITCSANDGSSIKATCRILVEYSTPDDIAISPKSKSIKIGDTLTMNYTLTPFNAVTSVTWTSDDESIATVSPSGVVQGIKIGTTFINVTTANGKTSWSKITVEESDYFTEPNKYGDLMSFLILSESEKTCKIEAQYQMEPAIAYDCSEIDIPSEANGYKVVAIGNWAFYCCYYVQALRVPEGVKAIEEDAFMSCSSLTDIKLPFTLNSIGECAFRECISLESITIPSNVTDIGNYVFTGCSSLKAIYSLGTKPAHADKAFMPYPNYDTQPDICSQTTLYVPKGTKSLYQNAEGWKKFQHIVEFSANDIYDVKISQNHPVPIFTPSGQRITKPRKGVNIIGGKKVLVK